MHWGHLSGPLLELEASLQAPFAHTCRHSAPHSHQFHGCRKQLAPSSAVEGGRRSAARPYLALFAQSEPSHPGQPCTCSVHPRLLLTLLAIPSVHFELSSSRTFASYWTASASPPSQVPSYTPIHRQLQYSTQIPFHGASQILALITSRLPIALLAHRTQTLLQTRAQPLREFIPHSVAARVVGRVHYINSVLINSRQRECGRRSDNLPNTVRSSLDLDTLATRKQGFVRQSTHNSMSSFRFMNNNQTTNNSSSHFNNTTSSPSSTSSLFTNSSTFNTLSPFNSNTNTNSTDQESEDLSMSDTEMSDAPVEQQIMQELQQHQQQLQEQQQQMLMQQEHQQTTIPGAMAIPQKTKAQADLDYQRALLQQKLADKSVVIPAPFQSSDIRPFPFVQMPSSTSSPSSSQSPGSGTFHAGHPVPTVSLVPASPGTGEIGDMEATGVESPSGSIAIPSQRLLAPPSIMISRFFFFDCGVFHYIHRRSCS